MILENVKIGILGGSRFVDMLVSYATELGWQVAVMDKNPQATCARYPSVFHTGDPLSYENVIEFGKGVDILTVERKDVDVAALRRLRDNGVRIYPSPEIMDIIQDKFLQKRLLERNGIPVVSGSWVAGRHELSVIVSRSERGVVECYDPVPMVFNGKRLLLDFQTCLADIGTDEAMQACNLAIKTAEAIGLTGAMTVQMLVDENGKMYVNDLAPRPRYSRRNAIKTSEHLPLRQQQMRLILGLPAGAVQQDSVSVMINILEPAAYRKHIITEALKTILCTSDVQEYWHKKDSRYKSDPAGNITMPECMIESTEAKAVMIQYLLMNE